MPEFSFFNPAAEETSFGHEYEPISPEAYVQELITHASSIPDPSDLPLYYALSHQETKQIGKYCERHRSDELKMEGVAPLFRDDTVDPDFCSSISKLTRKVAGNSPNSHWYAPETDYEPHPYYARNYQAKSISRRWELFYVGYMKQRRTFHASFMSALINKKPIDADVESIGLKDGEPIRIPSTDPYKSEEESAPNFLFNKANWLTSSLLSALALPPEVCDADMKRRAIEQWAKHMDFDATRDSLDFYNLRDQPVVQLPWSMRSNTELQTPRHVEWHQNHIIKQYLGEVHRPKAGGMNTLLQDRPKDYVQVQILRIFGGYGLDIKALRDLADTASMPEEIKKIIFAPDAAHNGIFSDKPVLPEFGQPTDLAGLLALEGGEITPQTSEAIIAGQGLRIHVLTNALADAHGDMAAQESRIDELSAANRSLAARVRQLEKTQQDLLPKTPEEQFMLEFGISPSVSDENLVVLVGAIRRTYNRKLHSDVSTDPGAEERLREIQEVNSKLDDILRSRGLGKNQHRE